jgi:hypothetical protein
MRSLGNRRAVLVAGVATVAAVALAGCSAGQVAETAIKRPSNQGVNQNNSNNTVGIRNFQVAYNGIDGYPAGGNAPLEGGLYNLTTQAVIVLISSRDPAAELAGAEVVSAKQVGLVGGAAPADSASPAGSAAPSGAAAPSDSASPAGPAQPAVQPARIVLPPSGHASFAADDPQSLQVVGLNKALAPGQSVNLVFEFSNGAAPLTLRVPVATPLTPAPRGSAVPGENVEGGE